MDAGCDVTSEMSGWAAVVQRCNSWLPKLVAVELVRLLFATTGGKLSLGELAVAKIPEDEDLLNIATWEAACLTWMKKCLKAYSVGLE